MWTPGGSQTRSKRAEVFGTERYCVADKGAKVVAGYAGDLWFEYTDWIAGLASVGLGYGYHGKALGPLHHTTLPLPHLDEERAAEELLKALPQHTGWDQVRWVTTGSEATLAAMMIARRATGRRHIISIGYHGWHESHLSSEHLVTLPIEAVDTGAWGYGFDGSIAAVLVEPMRNTPDSETGWKLGRLVERAREVGALVIMDEIVTGFRYALGGATEMFGLKPDLACYGKAMSNGYPIAAVVGNHKLMQHALDISSTYGGWPPALVAVRETVRTYTTEPVIKHLWAMGERLLGKTKGVLTGYPVHPVFTAEVNALELVQKAAAAGHLLHPAGFNIMYAHTEADVDSLAEVLNG